MRESLRRWIQPTAGDPELAQRQLILNIVLLGLAVPGFLFGLIMAVLWALSLSPPAGAISGLGVQPFYALSYWLGRKKRMRLAGLIPVLIVFLVMVASLFQVGIGHVSIIGFAMVVTTAGILIGVWGASLFTLLSAASYAAAGYAQTQGLITGAILPEAAIIADSVGLALGLSVLVVLNWLSNREVARTLEVERELSRQLQAQQQQLEEEARSRERGLERRAIQLETASDIAKLATETTDQDLLLTQAVELIRERFGFYHASLFMMDDSGTWAALAASTGEAGQKMLARRHRLAVGSASIIGWVTANRLPRVALDVDQDPFHLVNPLLPDTKAEMAVPLLVGQRLLGALDVQSTKPHAFDEDDIRALEAIASELAVALDSARQQREMMEELERAERSSRLQAEAAWSRLLRGGIASTIHLGPGGEPLPGGASQFSVVDDAALQAKTVISPDRMEIAAPIQVRGETIAMIAAKRPAGAEAWTDDDVALIESVAGQAALALENARQRAEEQRRVTELEVVNRVSQAVSQMLRLDSLYRIVHRQINQVLGDTDLIIALYDEGGDQIEIPYAAVGGEPLTQEASPLGEGPLGVVIRSRQPLLLSGEVDIGQSLVQSLPERLEVRSWLGVPMLLGEQILGAIAVQDTDREGRFTDDDAALLTTLASQIAAGIQNAKLLGQVQRAARRERLIHEITSKVRRSPDMKTILETATRELGRALNASRATAKIGTIQEKGGDIDSEGSSSSSTE